MHVHLDVAFSDVSQGGGFCQNWKEQIPGALTGSFF